MALYRGVDQRDVMLSIHMALDVLRGTGPLTAAAIDAFRSVDPATGISPLGGIATARTDEELADAVRASGIKFFLSEMDEVLAFHAVTGADGKAADIFNRLSAWDALMAPVSHIYTPHTLEMQTYLSIQAARHIGAQDDAARERFEEYMFGEEMDGATIQAAKDIINAARKSDFARAAAIFAAGDLHERNTICMALQQAADIPQAAAALHRQAPYAAYAYGVVLGDDPQKIDWQGAEIRDLTEKVQNALMPFYATDEVDRVAHGFIGDIQSGRLGIAFNATARAANAVADAMPEKIVIDVKGRRIGGPKP